MIVIRLPFRRRARVLPIFRPPRRCGEMPAASKHERRYLDDDDFRRAPLLLHAGIIWPAIDGRRARAITMPRKKEPADAGFWADTSAKIGFSLMRQFSVFGMPRRPMTRHACQQFAGSAEEAPMRARPCLLATVALFYFIGSPGAPRRAASEEDDELGARMALGRRMPKAAKALLFRIKMPFS